MKTQEQLAEDYADSQGARATTYGKSAWWPVRKDAFIAGYAALEERLAEAEGIMKRQQLSNQSCGFLFDEDIGAYFAKHPSPARGEDKV